MNANLILQSDDRAFLKMISQAIYSNPFSADHMEILRALADDHTSTEDAIPEKATHAIKAGVDKIISSRKFNFRNFGGKDRDLVRLAVLYNVFRQVSHLFDQLILNQIEAGDEPCHVPFADDVLAFLKSGGFNAAEAKYYFTFFYQLRRAFYFIDISLAGKSSSMQRLRCHLWNNIFTYDMRLYETHLWNRMEDFSTFLIGETGTGKGTAAAAIGRSGYIPFNENKSRFAESFTRNFLEINLSQYPEALIESELFGHRKGAFTGAVDQHQGVLARCRPHGAIFLDEIGDVSVPVQIKLLKVLQERTYSMVGSHEKHRFQGRVIAATNKSLLELRQSGKFRDDFYYRLCSDIIYVPSLRDQIKEDPETLSILLDHTIRRILGEDSPVLLKTIQDILISTLGAGYPWPGNVRELEQAVRRIIITQHYDGDMQVPASSLKDALHQGVEEGTMGAQNLLSSYCLMLYKRYGTYEEVARISRLDRRTVKKYVLQAKKED